MENRWTTWLMSIALGLLCISGSALTASAQVRTGERASRSSISHVLLISVDGLHAVDLARYIRVYPNSTMAKLAKMGVDYPNASTSKPSDSFPGSLSEFTGGSPRSTGVFYDDSYDRKLSPPGSNCKTIGTEVLYDETIDANSKAIDGGGAINPKALPLDPSKGCTPVYPHSFLRVNTVFEVVRAAGLRTAYSDKHLAYDLYNGPSGKGVEDLYSPEIAAVGSSVSDTEAYDNLKVNIILNQIAGYDHSGKKKVGVPSLFGMNFQAVSVAQKDKNGGYADSQGTPSALLLNALNFVDASLGKMVENLRARGLLSSTLIVLTAKHGQTPIDRSKRKIIDDGLLSDTINSIQKGLAAQVTADDVGLIWLSDQSKTSAAVAKLQANATKLGIQQILSGDRLKLMFNDPNKDSRTPDVIVLPDYGVIYAGPKATKIAEHGGFSSDDTNVGLLIAHPGLKASIVNFPVQTTQIAPTILRALDLDPQALQAVRMEKTQLLPGLSL